LSEGSCGEQEEQAKCDVGFHDFTNEGDSIYLGKAQRTVLLFSFA
jgi:hypothetical protein